MKYLKSHFWYNKSQRNGIFFLVIIILVLQLIYSFVDFSSNTGINPNLDEITQLQRKIDSLKVVEVEKSKPKIYPFNPNYITDYKGSQLGMSVKEIDKLFAYREQNKFVNSAKEFQQVTKVSDSLLATISPYFKFPEWVVKKNVNSRVIKKFNSKKSISTTNINFATAEDFKTIVGVGEKLSERIVTYRKRLQGFSFKSQLYEVWNLDKEVADKVLSTFKIIEKPIIKKINVNTATFKEVLSNPYIDYALCKKIFDFRDEVAELQSIEELKNIEGFPLDKYERIILYLEAK